MLREDASRLVTQLDGDVEHGIAGIAKVAESAQDFRGDEQPLGRAELRGVDISINTDYCDTGFHAKVEGASVAMRLLEKVLHCDSKLPW